MKITPASWRRPCTAIATPEQEPPEIITEPSFSIVERAEARATADFVSVSPVTCSTFFPKTPLPSRIGSD